MSKYGIVSGPYFPVFGLKMEIYVVNLWRFAIERGAMHLHENYEINEFYFLLSHYSIIRPEAVARITSIKRCS